MSPIQIPARFQLKVPAATAIPILEARIARGEQLLAHDAPDLQSPGDFRRAVHRWQAENDGIIDGLLEFGVDAPLLAQPIPTASVVLARMLRGQRLHNELSADVGELSKLLYRIQILAQPPWEETVEVSSPRPSDDVPPSEPAATKSRAVEPEVVDAPAPAPSPVETEPSEDHVGVAIEAQPPSDDRAEPVSRDDSSGDEDPIALAIAASAALPAYDADGVAQQDYVGIEKVVDAFSYLIAARTMQPPLAIGLFGQWGSGKTFLLRAIQRRVDLITRAARQSGRRQTDVGVYKRIAQVEFNAWHYVEGNLWASLVEHIFSNLRTSADEGGSELDRRRREITQTLTSTRAQQRTINSRIEQLARRRDRRTQEVTELEDRQRARLQEIQRLRLRDVASAAVLGPDDVQALTDVAERVGASELGDSAADAIRGLADARDVVRRSNALVAPMRQYGWRWALLLVAVVTVAPICSLLLEGLEISAITQVLASVGAFLGSATVVLGTGTRWAKHSLAKIEAAERRVRARVDAAAAEQAEQVAALQHEIDGIERELVDAAREREETATEIRALEDELAELTPGKVLASFLEQRSGSGDYRKQLGIAAVVRRDFEQLSQLVAANNEALLAAPEDAPASPTDFNRVVLYVDDLDRCPPSRVVEVLQAVHLLLSFPIFVVVLAVDPRWLAQSLASEYRDLLTDDATPLDGHATANDYLEKIFQIPFRVAPLDIDARTRFVDGLLGTVVTEGNGAVPADEALSALVQELEHAPAVEPDAQATDLAAVYEPRGEGEPGIPLLRAAPPEEAVDLNPASLRFTPAEAQTLRRLLPLLETSPRSIKRFVNVYRLIKSVGGIDGTAAVGAGPADHECAMLLLAMQTGLPHAGPLLLDEISKRRDEETLGALAKGIARRVRDDERASAELVTLRRWLADDVAGGWPLVLLAAPVRHVRLYSFG